MLIAALHDADEGGNRLLASFAAVQDMLADRGLAAGFFVRIDDLVAATGQKLVEVFGRAVELLRAKHEVHVGEAVDQFAAPALGHAAHEAEDLVRPFPAGVAHEVPHLLDGLLLGEIPDGAGVEQDDVRRALGTGEGIALGHELGGDGFAVALVHLATVGLDVDAGHPGTRWRNGSG